MNASTKRRGTSAVLLALVLCVMLAAVFAISASASDTAVTGATFSETSYFDQERTMSPTASITMEAELWLDPDGKYTNNPSVIYGNFKDNSTKGLDFLIRNGTYVELYLRVTSSTVVTVRFDDVNVRELCTGTADDPDFVKISVSVNTDDGTVILYVNGEKKSEKTNASLDNTDIFDALQNPFRIGGDLRAGDSNTKYFDGQLKNVAFYNDVRTASEVAGDAAEAEFSVDSTDANLLFAYDLTDTSVTGMLKDLSKYKNNAINPNTYTEPVEDNGFSFTSSMGYDTEEVLTPDGSMTVEALVTLPTDNNRCGWLICNWKEWATATHSMGIEFEKNRVVRLFLCSANTTGAVTPANMSYRFKLPEETAAGTYRKFTMVMNVSGEISCYVDGEALYCCNSSGTATESTSYDASSWMAMYNYFEDENEFFNQVTPFRVGGDYRANNSWYLHYLKVKSVAAYKGASADTSSLDAMVYYDLTDTAVAGCFSDLSGNDNDAIYEDEYDASSDYDYSFAVIGDTQYMTRWDVAQFNGVTNSAEHLKKVYDWILANKDRKNIKYVMGLGDITDSYNKTYEDTSLNDTAAEWAWAYSQISRLGGELPYSVVRGNHDNETYFDQYFANDTYESQFSDPDGYSCFYEDGSVRNAYNKFEVGTEKYILLLLDDNPTDAVLEWAGKVIERNADYRVIINTHTYLGYTGEHIDDSDTYAYATKDVKDGENNGEQIWEKLVSKYENIILVLSGHDYKATNIVRSLRVGENGNAVNEMLICPQSLDKNSNVVHKAGMVAMLYFSNGGKDIRVEYVSTHDTSISEDESDVYYNAEANNMSVMLMTAPEISKYGYIYPEYTDASEYPFIVYSEKGDFIGAYTSLLDCVSPYNNGGAVYRAKVYIGSNAWDSETGSYGDNPREAIILMRSDYSFASNESYDNMAHITGRIIIDLDGYTIYSNDSKSVFPTTIKPLNSDTECSTQIDVINGSFKVGAKALITLAASQGSASLDVSKKAFIYTFTDVTFEASDNTSNLIATYSSSVEANPTLIFNDCIFDLTEAPSEAVILNLGNGYVNSSATVNGGEIISNASADFVTYKNVATSDKITFGKTKDGNYTSLTLPAGAELPITSVNDGELVFVNISENADTVTYRLRLAELADVSYSPKMSITLANSFIMNVYIPTNYTQKFTFNGVTYENLSEHAGEIATLDDGNDYYLVTVALGSSEAASEISLVSTVTVEESTATASFTFSIPKYTEKILNDADATDTEKTLARDVLVYINEAYSYFNTHNDAQEIARVNALIESIIGDYTAAPESSGTTVNAAGVSGVTLNLDAKPKIRFYVTDTAIEFFANNKKLKTVTGVDETKGNYVELDVYAYALCETITYGNGGSYHISDFVDGASGLTHETLVKAFVKYVESAAAYRTSVIGAEN